MTQTPKDTEIEIARVEILYTMDTTNDNMGIAIETTGTVGSTEVVGLLEMAKHQYINDKHNEGEMRNDG